MKLLATILLVCSSAVQLQAEDKPLVVTTVTIINDIARQIGGDKVRIQCIVPVGGDPHLHDPTPGDQALIAKADLILRNGLHLEGWLDKMILNSGGTSPIVTVSDGVKPIVGVDGPEAVDPHAWMSPLNGIIYAQNIRYALSRLLPRESGYFEKRFQLYKQELLQLDAEIKERIATIPEARRILITTHDAFHYYAQRYGMVVESVLGISTDADVRMADQQHIYDVIRAAQLPAIFVESTLNRKLFEQISRDLGIQIGGELFADSVGDEESGADTYTGMLRHNTHMIVNGLRADLAGLFERRANPIFLLAVAGMLLLTFLVVAFMIRKRQAKGLQWESYTLEVRGLNVSYQRKTALSDINLSIENGNVVGIIGPNGSGKSTFFKGILGLLPVDSGEASINGTPIQLLSGDVAYIPQKEEIDFDFPATVLDVVLHGRYPHKSTFGRINKRDLLKAREALQLVEMESFEKRQIGQLSGGQQQRVFLARAICQEAEVYFLDEPFIGVDVTTEENMIRILKDLANHGKTVFVIHHDLSDVPEYFDILLLLNRRIVACGPTSEVFTDENIRRAYHAQPSIFHETETLERN